MNFVSTRDSSDVLSSSKTTIISIMTCDPKKVHVVFVLHKQEKESINRSTDDATEENFLKSTCTKRWKDQASFRFASDMLNQTLRSTSWLPGTVRTIKRKGWSWGLTLTLETKPGTRARSLEIRSLMGCLWGWSAAEIAKHLRLLLLEWRRARSIFPLC